jgi:deoxyribonuclease-4
MLVGTHIGKDKTFYKSLIDFYGIEENLQRPCQIFSKSPKVWSIPMIPQEDIDKTNEFVKQKNLKVFIHSSYLYNLSNMDGFVKFERCLKWELEIGKRLGFKGVVIHTGKSLKLPMQIALDNMYINIKKMLPFIDSSCPLLLETPSGQGTETLTKYEEFENFYNRFTSEEKEKLKICIDTCHVFASGYDPLDYIQNWVNNNPGTLILVHFNDSKCDKGSRKDRHEEAGNGFIGLERMTEIGNYCNEKEIPCVME